LPDELRLILAFGLAAGLALLTVPIAIRIAVRTNFFDHPVGYKGHGRPTPYLGGAAVMAAFLPAAFLTADGLVDFGAIVVCAVAFCAIGTVDDRIGLGPVVRLAAEIGAAVVLWESEVGWHLFNSELISFLITLLWVVGVVNAFNLLDNSDGAAGSIGLASAMGVAGLALVQDHAVLAAIALALAGACAGFLVFNLHWPARVFLGDGGSMPLGFLIAAMIMAAPGTDTTGTEVLLAMALLAGLPILDTTLVTLSRLRRGVPIFQGARDHVTHRLLQPLGSARAVALVLGVAQLALCAIGIALFKAGPTVIAVGAACYIVVGSIVIGLLEWPFGRHLPRRSPAVRPVQQESGP
jgi:UDP-GlcNAc:undecaprenyl-phosphate/decaprenyl-phosphate GlcNAc-1-phosphate transferase